MSVYYPNHTLSNQDISSYLDKALIVVKQVEASRYVDFGGKFTVFIGSVPFRRFQYDLDLHKGPSNGWCEKKTRAIKNRLTYCLGRYPYHKIKEGIRQVYYSDLELKPIKDFSIKTRDSLLICDPFEYNKYKQLSELTEFHKSIFFRIRKGGNLVIANLIAVVVSAIFVTISAVFFSWPVVLAGVISITLFAVAMLLDTKSALIQHHHKQDAKNMRIRIQELHKIIEC